MNWATVFVKRYQWDAVEGGKDAKGNDAQLRARVCRCLPGLRFKPVAPSKMMIKIPIIS